MAIRICTEIEQEYGYLYHYILGFDLLQRNGRCNKKRHRKLSTEVQYPALSGELRGRQL